MERIRLDLEGIALHDDADRLFATFRYRTRNGLILNLPESVDVTIPWADIAHCHVDLVSGELVLRFKETHLERYAWLGGKRELRGHWIDRIEVDDVPS
jgi:hypothetical protein